MRLFYSKASPYARMTRILVIELGLQDDVTLVPMHPFDNPPELLSANPLGKVPVLVTEHQVLCDSGLICDYLWALARTTEDVTVDWLARQRRALAVGMLDVAVAWRQDKMRPESQQSEFWQNRYRAALQRTLSHIESEMGVKSWPEFPAIESIALLCALDYLDFRHPEFSVEIPNISRWRRPLSQHPSVKATVPCD